MNNFKKLLLMTLLPSVLLVGCGQKNQSANTDDAKKDEKVESDTIKIGGLAPLTGNVAIYGTTASNGAKLAVKEINKNGGINGKQIEFILEDEKGDNTEAINAYNKLHSKGIDALWGDVTSKPTVGVAELANEDHVPMITPTGTQLNITEGKESVFRTCYTDPFQGKILAQYAKEHLNAKTFAMITNNSSDYSNGVAKAFKEKALELGLKSVSEESYAEGDTDFKGTLTKIKEKNPDVLLIPDYYQVVALMAPQIKEVGISSKLIAPDGWDGVLQQMDKSSYDSVNGALFTNHYAVNDTSEKIKKFVDSYKEEFKSEPSSFAALGYDAIYMFKDAFEKANSKDPKKVIEAIKQLNFDGVTGKLKFDDNNNPIKAVTIIKIEDGKYVKDSVVEPN